MIKVDNHKILAELEDKLVQRIVDVFKDHGETPWGFDFTLIYLLPPAIFTFEFRTNYDRNNFWLELETEAPKGYNSGRYTRICDLELKHQKKLAKHADKIYKDVAKEAEKLIKNYHKRRKDQQQKEQLEREMESKALCDVRKQLKKVIK